MIYYGKSAVQAGGVFAKAVMFIRKPRGHSNTSTSSTAAIRYTYNAAGDIVYDQDKGLTYSYNALGLVSQVLRADGTGLQYRYAADGTLVTSTETQAAAGGGVAVSSRVFYLAVDRHDALSGETYVHTPFGATLLDAGLSAKHVGFHADHLRVNGVEGPRSRVVILAYSDLNSDGFVDPSTEILEENRYYPSVWTGVGAPAQALKLPVYTRQSTALPFAYNGSRAGPLHPIRSQEQNGFGMHLTTYRTMAPEVAFWRQTDPKVEWQYGMSPYAAMNGNPITYADPEGDIAPIIVAAIIGAAIGGIGNTAYQYSQGNINNWGDGFKASGIGARTGAIGAAGASFIVMGGAALRAGALASSVSYSGLTIAGYSLGTTGAVSGAVTGAISGAISSPLRQGGNMLAGWQDKFSVKDCGVEAGSGLVMGAMFGAVAGGLEKTAVGSSDASLGHKLLWGNSVKVPGAGSIAVGLDGRIIDAKSVAELANNQGLQTAQKGALDQAKIQSLLTDMDAGTFNATKYAAGGYRDGARTIIVDGNHRVTAARIHGMKTGDYKIANQLINAGNFQLAPSGTKSFSWISKWK